MNPSITLSALIAQSAQQLDAAHTAGNLSFGHGTTNAADEAAWLVLWKLGLPLDTDVSDEVHNIELPAPQVASVQAFIEHRIASRKPAAYLTQEAWLQGVSFYIDERAIVPRSLIAEVLAEGSIDPWLDPNTTRVLDLCTGNGSLGILAALAFPDITVQGLDLSTDTLAVAQINIERHGLEGRMTLAESDGLAKADGVFDLILCNPPYVNAQSMSELPAEFKAEAEALRDAIVAAEGGKDPIKLIVRSGRLVREVAIQWNGGLRYPRLEKIGVGEGNLDKLLAPLP